MERIKRLYEAITATVEMDGIDKANLMETLCHISEKQFIELEAVYVYEMY